EQALSFCNAHGCQPRIACRSAQITTIQSLIALNQGVSLLPAMAQRVDGDKRRVYRPLAGDAPRRTIAVIWRRQRHHSPTAERFLERPRDLAAKPPSARRTDPPAKVRVKAESAEDTPTGRRKPICVTCCGPPDRRTLSEYL